MINSASTSLRRASPGKDFQVFCRRFGFIGAGRDVVQRLQLFEVTAQDGLCLARERGEGALCRAVIATEKFHRGSGVEWITQTRCAAGEAHILGDAGESGANDRLISPQERRRQSGGRWEMTGEYAEHFLDEAIGRPVGEGDETAGFGDAAQLNHHPLQSRREHHPEHTHDDVEAGGGVGHRFRVAPGRLFKVRSQSSLSCWAA